MESQKKLGNFGANIILSDMGWMFEVFDIPAWSAGDLHREEELLTTL